jgi:hypothetical protein
MLRREIGSESSTVQLVQIMKKMRNQLPSNNMEPIRAEQEK